MRLFTCVWVPDELRGKIKKFQDEMANLQMRAKFVEAKNLHFTVTFLGETPNENLQNLKDKLDDSVKDINKFDVKIKGLKLIPNESYIRVIGIKVSNGKSIANLIKNVADLIGGKYYLEQKITLCRVKKIFKKNQLQNFIEKEKNVGIGEFQVNKVSLVESVLTRSGPIYKTIHDSYLK
jgi:2'-5' RNA ligase